MRPLPPARRTPEGSLLLSLGADLPDWEGHFPGDPVLPGVVQVDWAIRFGEQVFGPLGRFAGLDRLKFLAPLRPGGEVELRLAVDPASHALSFQYLGPSGPHSTGLVRFQPVP
jgi:3-hydroxymyristoyl/3-hydroxydecanoyl-(acyl carrier protein) dehydratase